MDKVFLSIYVLLIGFILSCIILDLAKDEFKKHRVFVGMFWLVLTGVVHALITLWK